MSKLLKQSVPLSTAPSRWLRARRWLRRHWQLSALAGALLTAVLVWVLWPSTPQRYMPDPRSRQFSSFTVCMLTGSHGITDPQAAPVWSGVDDAAKATGLQSSYLSVPAPDTEAAAEVYVNTVASRHCSLVIAAETSEVAAVNARAPQYPSQRFVVVGAGASASNVVDIPSGSASATRAAVAGAVERAVAGRSG